MEASPTPFVVDEFVRWSDVDKAGIIFYGSYVRFFEIAETELFRAAGLPYGKVFDEYDVWFPRVHLECDFKYPARLDDQLRVAAYFTRFGESSVQINFDVVHRGANRIAAAGHEVLVCIDRADGRPSRIPDPVRKRLASYKMTPEQARQHLGLPSS